MTQGGMDTFASPCCFQILTLINIPHYQVLCSSTQNLSDKLPVLGPLQTKFNEHLVLPHYSAL